RRIHLIVRLILVSGTLVPIMNTSLKAEEAWLYFGAYPNVWSHNQQSWIYFEHPTQPTYRYNDGEWPVLYDHIPLDVLDAELRHIILLRTDDDSMLIRFAADGGPAHAYELDDAEPLMEGVSNYSINDRTNTILLSVL